MSEGFFDKIIIDTLNLVNEEFDKLRLNIITRDNLLIFFDDATAGIQISVETTDSRKKILNNRLIKIAFEIQERYSIPGFSLIVD